MKQYRIKEYCNSHTKNKSYEIQKKSFLGFWYNPLNIDAYTTGFYDTFDEAKEAVALELSKTNIKIVFES